MSRKTKGHKRAKKQQKRYTLRAMSYLASGILSLVKLAFLLWDRFHK